MQIELCMQHSAQKMEVKGVLNCKHLWLSMVDGGGRKHREYVLK